ncbi:MAG: hypothetical protein H7336_03450 [Bacteriovorax sp.]|nr:hypothetical protein [Bacteriovorax sp.]
MKIILVLILSTTLASTVMAQSTPRNGDEKDYKSEEVKHKKTSSDGAGKEVKTNGKISTSGCETKEGKTITEAEQGYDECVRQVGLKKKHKKKD